MLWFSDCTIVHFLNFFFSRIDKESLEAEMKKLEEMQEKVKNMLQQQHKDERAAKKKGNSILICSRSVTRSSYS